MKLIFLYTLNFFLILDNSKQTLEILELEKILLGLLEGLEENFEIQISALNNCAMGSLIRFIYLNI